MSDVPPMDYVEERQGPRVVITNVCKVCFGVVHDGLMGPHLNWHRLAASPQAHGMYVESVLKDGEQKK